MDDEPHTLLRGVSPTALLAPILALLALGALHLTASVTALIAAGLFTAMLVEPIDRHVARALPDGFAWAGHVAAILALLGILSAFAAALWFCGAQLAEAFGDLPGGGEAPASGEDRGSLKHAVRDMLSRFDLSLREFAGQLADAASGFAMTVGRAALATVGGLVLVVFLALMMLTDAKGWNERLGTAARPGTATSLRGALRVIARQVRRFALIRLAMGAATAALYAAWIWVMGLDLIWVWALLTVLLSFVPSVGSLISGVLPTLYAFLTKDFGTAFVIGAGIFAIEQVLGNFIDPKVSGRELAIAPLALLVALLIWSWVWGVPGALLATPMTIAMVVLFARVPALRPLALMISNREDYEALDRIASP